MGTLVSEGERRGSRQPFGSRGAPSARTPEASSSAAPKAKAPQPMAVTDVLPRPRRISPTSSVERPAHGSPTYAGEAEWQSARVVDIRLDGCLAAKFEEIAANQRLLQDAARQSASKCDAMARRISRLEAQQEGAKARVRGWLLCATLVDGLMPSTFCPHGLMANTLCF